MIFRKNTLFLVGDVKIFNLAMGFFNDALKAADEIGTKIKSF